MTETLRTSTPKRRAIVDAAIAEFQASGFLGTSMDAVAAAAGVSKRTVYNYFPSKEDLFRHICKTACSRAMHSVEEPYRPTEELEEQLVAIADQKVALLSSEEFLSMARVTMVEHLRSPELTQDAFDEIQRGESDVVRWIRAAAADGRLAVEDPVIAGKELFALLKAFAFWPQLFRTAPTPDAAARERIARSAVALFLDHYGRG